MRRVSDGGGGIYDIKSARLRARHDVKSARQQVNMKSMPQDTAAVRCFPKSQCCHGVMDVAMDSSSEDFELEELDLHGSPN